jgi:hypothetical protein
MGLPFMGLISPSWKTSVYRSTMSVRSTGRSLVALDHLYLGREALVDDRQADEVLPADEHFVG